MTSHEDKIKLADAAITHVLHRIRTSPEVGYYMGVCTESFELLLTAYAAIHIEPKSTVEAYFLPIFAKDPTKELQERIEDLERSLSGRHYVPDDDPPTFGPQNLSADDFLDKVKLLLVHADDAERFLQEVTACFDLAEVPYPLIARS